MEVRTNVSVTEISKDEVTLKVRERRAVRAERACEMPLSQKELGGIELRNLCSDCFWHLLFVALCATTALQHSS